MTSASTLLDERAIVYALTLLVALLTDAALLVAAVVLSGRLGRAANLAAAAPALHGVITLLATAAHYAAARAEAVRFGAGAIAIGVFNVGAWGMALVHLGGAASTGMLFLAVLRLAPKDPRSQPLRA